MKYSCLLLAALLLFLASPVAHAQNTRRDGNWWKDISAASKHAYVVGFFDGMDLGNNFSYWGILDEGKTSPCTGKVVTSYSDYTQKFFANVTNEQLADGLDVFYKDYRNRSIKIQNAVWLVVNGIAGTPQSTLDKMIENWRKSASTN